MNEASKVLVLITTATEEEARSIAELLNCNPSMDVAQTARKCNAGLSCLAFKT